MAVGASSAFPPVLSPVRLDLDPAKVTNPGGCDLNKKPYTKRAYLSDGGVYDNLGLETAWKSYDTVLVSDAGGQMQADPEPDTDWGRHSARVLNVIDNQVRSLRKRQLLESYASAPGKLPPTKRRGAYWGIRSDIKNYGLAGALDYPNEASMRLANIATRLKSMDDDEQMKLINWGYAVCDAAMRKHMPGAAAPKPQFPYPAVEG